MVRSTHIARASDALPLAASVDDEEVSSYNSIDSPDSGAEERAKDRASAARIQAAG